MILERDGLDTYQLVSEGEYPVFDKYDEYIPAELLCDAYAIDRLFADEVIERFGGGV
jgi:cobalamin biosynthesis protein CobT